MSHYILKRVYMYSCKILNIEIDDNIGNGLDSDGSLNVHNFKFII